ncbi:helix-turn-helix domain-containing protein [Streptacidiphilus carbonis]|uniref:helix-turn-helix domain-containing protein n=1 Tax=Streptacidiphilus carbonis TaxID=105422 RepID=UPI001378A9E8|nr:helix-turn-helix transcriptional regulator [Streptacidiphilus carbonis]
MRSTENEATVEVPIPAQVSGQPALAGQAIDDIRDMQDALRQITRNVNQGGLAVEALPYVVDLERHLRQLTRTLTTLARDQRTPWRPIGRALGVSPDTARGNYRGDHADWRLSRTASPRTPTASANTHEQKVPDLHAEPISAGDFGPASNRLSPMLSKLARGSGLIGQTIADQVGCSPSYLSRVLSGDRVPTWSLTERLARVCNGDPDQLRRPWELERLREQRPRPALLAAVSGEPDGLAAFRTALRTLYIRAGRPHDRELALAVGWRLADDRIHNILNDATLPTWGETQLVVRALAGDTVVFHRLWHTAAAHTGASTSCNDTCTCARSGGQP